MQNAIGSGAYGSIFIRKYYGMTIAFKKIPSMDIDSIKEALTLNKLKHENIVRIFGVVTDPQNFGICMEYLPEGSLYDYLHKNKKTFRNDEIQNLVLGMIHGMSYLHANHVVHRDLKSPNVLLKRNINNLTSVICDFGMSRFINTNEDMDTFRIGSRLWNAPEILRGERYNNKCDVYSFALIVWELINGVLPYKDLNLSQNDLVKEIAQNGRRSQVLIKPNSNITKVITEIIKMCWNQDPSLRPSFVEILEKFEDFELGRSTA